ncbi:response regulator [Paenibacillus tengchongensis]|uniref:response regulator n=1 Tax=Paenibacillus tengchongensis TaxID=2608684 RepID=UPI00124C96DA|nr:response regulator [Paenibacillus tengchongensis]
MAKVLIIDDEEPLREAIHILGDWEDLGVTEVLEAKDGRSGLAMLREHRIDIALVDMKMPELSGPELLHIAQHEFPELLLIVISGYEDFRYTQQAIRSKAVDYLLKPVNRADLNGALRKAVDMLAARRQRENEFINRNITLNMSLPKLKEKLYLSILERSFKSHSHEASLPLIGAGVPGNVFAAGILRLLNLEQVRSARFHGDRELMRFAVTNVLNENSIQDFEAFSFADPKEEREVVAIFTLQGSYGEETAYHSMHHLRKAVSMLKELFGIVCVGGIGQPCREVPELAHSYEEAKAALDRIDLLQLKPNTVAGSNDARPALSERPSLTGKMPLLRNFLESGNFAQAKNVLNEVIHGWQTAGYFNLGDADRTIQEFIILLNDAALELGAAPEALRDGKHRQLSGLGISGDYTSFGEFAAVLGQILSVYAAEIGRSLGGDRGSVLENIKAYIDNHYFENIKISMFTDKYFLSREYLMKLFKGQYGYGIHEYVQKVRMDKAKELLSDPGLKIQDISEMLGYRDKNYFSKAFRNYYDCSPSEFRMMPPEVKK